MRDFAKASGILAKTDALDARGIARFGHLFQPPATVFASEAAQQLQDWVRRRPQLVELLSGEKNRLQPVKGRHQAVLTDDVEAHIEWLKDRIAQLDEKIEQLSQQSSQWRQDRALLSGRILEQYSDTGRGESCLVLGYAEDIPIHIVCGWRGDRVAIITVYIPGPPKFIDPETRA